jgi:hypothetical protein
MDPLTDPKACTRDAALMERLGVNNIYVKQIDPSANHDDCFSIFNSVGIYVTIVLAGRNFFINGIDRAYTTEHFEDLFRRFDAIKDYENVLGVDVGYLPNFHLLHDSRGLPKAQNIFRVSPQIYICIQPMQGMFLTESTGCHP